MTQRTGRILLALLLPLFCLLLIGYADRTAETNGFTVEPAFHLTHDNGRYDLHAERAPLRDLLEAIGQKTGIPMRIDPGLEGEITLHAEQLSAEELLKVVAESHAVIYEVSDDGTISVVSATVTDLREGTQPEVLLREQTKGLTLDPGVLSNLDRPLAEIGLKDRSLILLRNAVIDTKAARQGRDLRVPERFEAEADNAYYIVQFDHPASSSDRAFLQDRGAQVCHYVPHAAYAVRCTAETADLLKEAGGVSYVGPYHPYYKMSRDILSYMTEDEPAAMPTERVESGVYNVLLFRGADDEGLFDGAGAEILRRQTAGDRVLLTVRSTPESLEALLHEQQVQWIEPNVAPRRMSDLGRRRIRSNELKTMHPFLDGSGVTIGIADSGIDFKHPGFAIDPTLPTSTNDNTRIVYYEARTGGLTADGQPGDTDGHGTHVAGVILGNGALSDTVVESPGSGPGPYRTNAFAGVAPAASVVMLEDFNSISDAKQAQIAYEQGARIANNSWGNTVFEYGTLSLAWDELVRDANTNEAGNQEYIVFFSAGNSGGGEADGTAGSPGTIGQPANAKNVIAVGAVEQARYASNLTAYGSVQLTDSDWQIASYSSRGPVGSVDRRIKPDIVAPGSWVMGPQSHEIDPSPDNVEDPPLPDSDYRSGNVDTGTNYAYFSGTSFASPMAAGGGALVYQYYTNEFDRAPSPAMIKAILVNGAQPVNAVLYPPPGWITDDGMVLYSYDANMDGWGMLNVARAVDGPGHFATDEVVWQDQNDTTPLETDQEYDLNYTVNTGEGGLRITLAWTDPAGTPGNELQLVNDLDLIVTAPDGSGYVGNLFNGGYAFAWRGVESFRLWNWTNTFYNDRENNIEVVSIPDAQPGTYTITVKGYQVAEGPQDFALAIMKGTGALRTHTEGDHPDLTVDTNQYPVVTYAGNDDAGQKQIYVKRWVGPTGDRSEIGLWKRLDDHWFDLDASARDTGISKTAEESGHPAIAMHGNQIAVAWVEEPQNPLDGTSHIFMRLWNGSNWQELDGSAHDFGVSGGGDYDATDAMVGFTTNGDPVVAWKQPQLDGTTYEVQIRVLRWDGAQWRGLDGSTNGVAYSVQDLNEPDMTMDGNGNPVIAFQERPDRYIQTIQWSGASWNSLGTVRVGGYASEPSLYTAANGDLYLAWVESGWNIDNPNTQIYAMRNTGGGWQAMGDSAAYPGISEITELGSPQPHGATISAGANGNAFVAWQFRETDPNAILLKEFDGTNWTGIQQSDIIPGIARAGGIATNPVLAADGFNLPIIAYESDVSEQNEIFVYRLVTDEAVPAFSGLRSATGGTNQDVTLTWDAAVDSSTTIYYHVYQSTQWWACGDTPSCNAGDVFANEIAILTNTTSFVVTGLQNDRLWCFGVRAEDTNLLMEANQVMRSAGPTASGGDTDGDCLINALEFAAGTEPCLKDTDEDGMWDGWEWAFSTNNPAHVNPEAMDPLDNGMDRVRTDPENDGETDQLPDADLDGDGASNFEEFEWWYNNMYLPSGQSCALAAPGDGPDPTDPDTDGDGMNDGWEIFNELSPTNGLDGALDFDGDGVANSNEFIYGIDPRHTDSDSDGVLDGDEITNGTDPALADTDGDGLDDGFDPDAADADSNDSGLSDGDTFQLGWNNPAAPLVNFNTLIDEDFEDTSATRPDWTHYWTDGAHQHDFWHITSADPAPPSTGVVYMSDHTTPKSYRMAFDPSQTNVNAGYSTGSVINCALQSPPLDATEVTNLFMTWNEYYDTESGEDFVQVQVRSDEQPNWQVVSQPRSGRSNGWTNRLISLEAFAGHTNVLVRFLFSADSEDNNHWGWWVDDVHVYAGVTISGWVRDNNGRPLAGVQVAAIGRGGVTNAINGHAYVLPGKIFGSDNTADDGSYLITGLPRGRYYVKAIEAGYGDEFYNGSLFAGAYAFGTGLNPGVLNRDEVAAAGWLDLTALNAAADCHFELERGSGRGYLGVMLRNPAGATYRVFVNDLPTEIWDGVADTNKNADDFLVYRTSTNNTLINNHPDWETNAVQPELLADLAFGSHRVYAGTNLNLYPLAELPVREGEITLVSLSTNQGAGRLYVTAEDDETYPVWINGRDSGEATPALIAVKAGTHVVTLVPSNSYRRIVPKLVNVGLGTRARVNFEDNALTGNAGTLRVRAVDVNGNAVSGATVYVDGQLVTSNNVVAGETETTPTIVNLLMPGNHYVALRKPGYSISPRRSVVITEGNQTELLFVLYEADADYDLVGDFTEISGYTNIFRYSRGDDPDVDGLDNFFEFAQFRLFNVRMNIFDPDSDGDGMSDGNELGYDGNTNRLAISTLASNVNEGADALAMLFAGDYLDGIDNFGSGNIAAAVDCDRFEASVMQHPAPVVPSVFAAQTRLSGIPGSIANRTISQGHNQGAQLLGDALPDVVDTDGDGMWDGFEFDYGLDTVAKLDPIGCGQENADPDFDGASNMEEFLGPDGIANTNDWTDPTDDDTDGDGIPDGWEYDYGLDPTDAADGDDDSDNDGLTSLDEYLNNANPTLADTDADGLPDGPEVHTYRSDPNLRDTDSDGLLDGREVWDRDLDGEYDGGFFGFPTNWNGNLDGDAYLDGPQDFDTDGDGMPDGFEVIDAFGNLRDPALDPYDPSDGDDTADADGDGLSNLEEYLVRDALIGSQYHPGAHDPAYIGAIWDYSTDPFNADSDGDGMPDGWEVLWGLHPMDPIPTDTDPFERYPTLGVDGDLDHDGLFNQREFTIRFTLDSGAVSNSATGASTDPWNDDSDDDGLGDGEEDRTYRSSPIQQDTDNDGLMDGTSISGKWSEVEAVPRLAGGGAAVSNHYDQALNDLWQLSWPKNDQLPHWERVVLDTNSPVPEARWGTAATFIPVFESKVIETVDGFLEDIILLDNRQFVVMGGRDGVERFTNVWEYVIRSNAWVESDVNLNHVGLDEGLSEFSAITLFGYNDTKQSVCPCGDEDDQPYDCDGTTFGLPKSRPWDNGYQQSSFDWTYILGGWDESHDYYFPSPMASYYYKSSDSPDPVVEELVTVSEGWNNGQVLTAELIPIGTQLTGLTFSNVTTVAAEGRNYAQITNQSLVSVGNFSTNGLFFTNVNIDSDADILSARLELPFFFGGASDNDFELTGELVYNGRSEENYTSNFYPAIWRSRWSEFLSVTQQFSVSVAGGSLTTNVDVRPIVTQMLAQANWKGESAGFILRGTTTAGAPGQMRVGQSTLRIIYREPSVGYDRYGCYFFPFSIRTNCEEVFKAELEFHARASEYSSNRLWIVGELYDYTKSDSDYRGPTISNRLALGWLTSETNFPVVIPGAGRTITNVDITPLVMEMLSVNGWAAESLAFIIYGEANGGQMYFDAYTTRLRLTYKPGYKGEPYWQTGSHLPAPASMPSSRKSLVQVYDYHRDRIVAFGGMDGRFVYGTTYEGTPVWNDLDGSIVYANPMSVDDPRYIEWEKISTGSSPAPRWGHSMVYDGQNQRVVLFGGFDANHHPLNDMWVYEDGSWTEITAYTDTQVPQPRGGAGMIFFGGTAYERGMPFYCLDNEHNDIVLFGGTDGTRFFNDTWVYSDEENRWILVNPVGEQSQGPSPRAFPAFSWAQNAATLPDPLGNETYLDLEIDRCATAAGFLFGGRTGLLPTSGDTDYDLIPDGVEHTLGGPDSGRDPRQNALVFGADTNEIVPYAFLKLGSVAPTGFPRGTIANLEALTYFEGNNIGDYARIYGLPYQGHRIEGTDTDTVYRVGVDAHVAEFTSLWYHRDGGEDPLGPGNAWELGVPNNEFVGDNGAPPYAYSGRWCYGTDLNGNYPNDSIMELYSPLFSLALPPSEATATNNPNSFYLVYHEWLDLNDSNDVVRLEVVRPTTQADVVERVTGDDKDDIVLAIRNNAQNTGGQWRRVIHSLDAAGNESNLYLRFTLDSDAAGRAGGWYIDDIAIFQGAEISGTLSITNGGGSVIFNRGGVTLLGNTFFGQFVTNTLTTTNGYFEFGALPLGKYQLGAVYTLFSPIQMAPTGWNYNIGATNVDANVPFSIGGGPAGGVAVSWPTVPGLTYRLEYSSNPVGPYSVLTETTAASTNETYISYPGDPLGFYRVRYVGGP